jgi:hypothetical protein
MPLSRPPGTVFVRRLEDRVNNYDLVIYLDIANIPIRIDYLTYNDKGQLVKSLAYHTI